MRSSLVDCNRKTHRIFVQEHTQRLGRHHRMVLKHTVQADHRDLSRVEMISDTLRLRQTMPNAAWAQHLERVQHHNLAT